MLKNYVEYKVTGIINGGDKRRTLKADGICREEDDALTTAIARMPELAACDRFRVTVEPLFTEYVGKDSPRREPIGRQTCREPIFSGLGI